MGPWALDRNVQAVRTMFRWSVDVARLMDRAPWYGDQFGKSTEGEKRESAREKQRVRGDRRFTVEELAVILKESAAPLKAMILLGLNGGMYATDIARLRRSDLKIEGRLMVVDFDRTKTGGVWWKFPLWPETRKAIDEALSLGRKPRDDAHADLVFLTARGNPWHRETVRNNEAGMIDGVSETHGIGQELDKILDKDRRRGRKTWKLRRAGVGFGSLRHTHVSAVGDHADIHAARRVRGHKHSGIEKHYDVISIDRLKAVTDLVRRRVYLPATGKSRSRKLKAA
jgi:integrase